MRANPPLARGTSIWERVGVRPKLRGIVRFMKNSRFKTQSFLYFLLIALTMPGTHMQAGAQKRTYPIACGSFIQCYLVKNWGDKEWLREFKTLKQVGMSYLVLGDTLDIQSKTTYYRTQLPGFSIANGYLDTVDACLRNAEKTGFKVFIGLGSNEEWWQKGANDTKWIEDQMNIGNLAADEMHSAYHLKYPHAFYGWYWTWEVDNYRFNKPEQIKILSEALNTNLKHLGSKYPAMPFMLCPFMNSVLGKPEAYAHFWKEIFRQTAFKSGDIFCPQDCVGAGGLKLNQVPQWFAALKLAVDTKPGLHFWADTETFRESDWTSATIDRLITQMKFEQPYVEQCMTFAYSHYDSPTASNPGFHRTYLNYVKSGNLQDESIPTPINFQAKRGTGHTAVLTWEVSGETHALCGFDIIRNGSPYKRIQFTADKQQNMKQFSFIERDAVDSVETKYALKCYGFAGNSSKRVETSLPRVQ